MSEFKADAVSMVIDGERSIVDVARGLGLVEQTLGTGCVRPGSTGVSGPG